MRALTIGTALRVSPHIASTAAATLIVALFAVGYARSCTMQWEGDARSRALARQSAMAGLAYARAHLACSSRWQRAHQESGLLQLYTAGPYRAAFAVRSTPIDHTFRTFRVESFGLTADFLRPRTQAFDLRGAGGLATREFPWTSRITTVMAQRQIRVGGSDPSARSTEWIDEPTLSEVDDATPLPLSPSFASP